MKEFGFQIGNARSVLIKGTTEKMALKRLIDNYWDIIDEEGKIDLLGEVIEKTTIEGI